MNAELSTRNKILDVAHSLFSDKGYDGVSVREIAKSAEVNLSAINYHFTNKENLYRETIEKTMKMVATDLGELYHHDLNVEDFSLKLFIYFKAHVSELRMAYKVLLNNPEEFVKACDNIGDVNDRIVGPPGGSIYARVIRNNCPNAKNEDIYWAVRCLFSTIMQKALMACTHIYDHRKEDFPDAYLTIEEEIIRLTRVVVADL
jgi:AcrR family transcriptional regulator